MLGGCECWRLRADLTTFTRKLEVPRERLPGWPGERLTVLAEQASVFYDLLTPDLMELVSTRMP
jgi:hypothetical protein